MHKNVPCLVFSVCVLTSALTVAAAPKVDIDRIEPVPANEPVPIVDFFRPALFHSPRFNPSGTHIAGLVTAGDDTSHLISYELKTEKVEAVSGWRDTDVYDFAWLSDKRLIFSLSSRKLYGIGVFCVNAGHFDTPYPILQYYGARWVTVPLNNRVRPMIWASHDASESGKDLGILEVNTDLEGGHIINLLAAAASYSDLADARENNEKHIVGGFPVPRLGLTVAYHADKNGEPAYATTVDNGIFILYRWTGTTWERCPIDLEKVDFISAGDEPGQIVVLAEREPGVGRALRFMDAATGKPGDVLVQDPGYDFNGWVYRDPVSHNIVGAIYSRNGPNVVWFSEAYRAVQKGLNAMFPGLVVRLIGSDDQGKKFLVSTHSDRQPAIYYWVDMEKLSYALVKNSAPWIDPKRMQPMNTLKFKTRDGKSLDAYLTLPAGASKKNPPPLVVLPHGGPWVRDNWGFNGEVQFLASRGYAVLQPNYRGSTGYTWMFPESDEWDFRKMHDDVTDAVKAIIASGYVDPKRVGIMGSSFGGYLAISGVANEPGLYRCAVTIAGVFDWGTMLREKKRSQFDSPEYGRLVRELGDPAKEVEKYAAISPLRRLDQVRVPVFVSHGKDDPVVDIGQSSRLVSELERNHIPHETLIVGEEGHGMGRLKNRVELYGRIETFLAKNLTPTLPSEGVAGAGPAK